MFLNLTLNYAFGKRAELKINKLVHTRSHEKNSIKVCAILEDSSRKILAGGEYPTINTENSMKVIDQMVERYWIICPMRELIMDHGAEFGAHRRDEKGEWDSEFIGRRLFRL